MNIKEFLEANTKSLKGKTVLLTGATGGLGRELCRYAAGLEAKLLLVNRDPKRAAKLMTELLTDFPEADIQCFSADYRDTEALKSLCAMLRGRSIDFLIHNAGAYALSGEKTELGLEQVFQINFLAPYYITSALLPELEKSRGKVILTGSIAMTACRAEAADPDFSQGKSHEAVYANSKRYLVYSHIALLRQHPKVRLGIAHPGISPTGITSHYPLLLRGLIKLPMKISFMAPEKACLPVLLSLFKDSLSYSWLGPGLFNIWGKPALSVIKGGTEAEEELIYKTAQELCLKIS